VTAPVAVFDCMILLQAAANPAGAAGACFAAAEAGSAVLVVSPATRAEFDDVLSRRITRRRFKVLTDSKVDKFVARLTAVARLVGDVPDVIALARDPKDSKYLNLAVAANAAYVVSRDNDLLDLMTSPDPEPAAFRAAHPALRIVTPPDFLAALRPDPPAAETP
jgi:putative PIN family toxin of toxin-antitoxin system